MSPLALLAGMLLFFSACGKKHCLDAPDVSHIPMEVHIGRLEKSLHKIPSAGQLGELLQRQPMFAEAFLGLSAYRPDSAQMEAFVGLMNDPNIDSLFIEIDRVYGDLSGLEDEFSTAFRHITYHYPDFHPPAIRTVATGMVHDLYVSDSLLIIGLDWYLGEDSPYRPNLYAYLLKRYQPAYLVPQLMLHFAAHYTPPPADATTLSEMIYYGKIFYFARHMLPCAPDSLFTGYTAEETADIGQHEPVIWASVLENELLFETNHTIVRRLFEERPKVLEIGEKCPGRIGRWLGYRIVSAYMAEHPALTIPELMAMQDARAIFNESKYRPVPY